jgi:hypothetical protein
VACLDKSSNIKKHADSRTNIKNSAKAAPVYAHKNWDNADVPEEATTNAKFATESLLDKPRNTSNTADDF